MKRQRTATPAPRDARSLLDAGARTSAGALILTLSLSLAAGGAWGAWAEVEEIVRATGKVEPEGRVKTVNHPRGGKVAEVLVEEGQRVEAGQVLLRFDGRRDLAERERITADLAAKEAEVARLRVAIDGEGLIDPGSSWALERPELYEQAQEILEVAAQGLEQKRRQLAEGVAAKRRELDRALAEAERADNAAALLADQHAAVKELTDRGLYPRLKLLEIERQLSDAQGEANKAKAGVGAARSSLAEAESRSASFEKDEAGETLERLAAATAERDRLLSLLEGGQALVEDLEAKAPVAGVVQDLALSGPGQSVEANAPLLTIVPAGAELVIRADVPNDDISRVRIGMPAAVKVLAYDFARYGSLPATVTAVAADATRRDRGDLAAGAAAYGVTLSADRLSFGEARPVRPGMAVDVELKVGSRSILSFLTDGLTRWREGALKEG